MFQSFFPKPELFFPSVVIWSVFVVGFWYVFGNDLGLAIGFDLPQEAVEPVIGLGHFTTIDFIWFYLYYVSLPRSLPGSGLSTRRIAGRCGRSSAHRSFCFPRISACRFRCHQQLAAPFFDAVQNALDPNTEIAVTAAIFILILSPLLRLPFWRWLYL